MPAAPSDDAQGARTPAASIEQAIGRGVDWLIEAQQRDGSWSSHAAAFPTGQTAFSVYTLLMAGVPRRHSAVLRAEEFLVARMPRTTYEAGCQLLAFVELDAKQKKKRHKKRIKLLCKFLLDLQRGTWPYPASAVPRMHGDVDLSLTQFALLGLWAASRSGAKVPTKSWQNAITGALGYQERPHAVVDGDKDKVAGFRYRTKGGDATGSMTCAGLSVLGIARRNLGRKLPRELGKKLQRAVKLAVAWLTTEFSIRENPGRKGTHYHYYLWALERAATLFSVSSFGKKEWYSLGVTRLIASQHRTGGWLGRDSATKTCFSLLFLMRATRRTLGYPNELTPKLSTGASTVRPTPEWQLQVARIGASNQLHQTELSAKSSSVAAEAFAASKATDRLEHTSWRWHERDRAPWLELHFEKPVPAKSIYLSGTGTLAQSVDKFQLPKAIELYLNGSKKPLHFDVPKDALRPATLEFAKRVPLRKLRIVVRPKPAAGRETGGIAEIVVLR